MGYKLIFLLVSFIDVVPTTQGNVSSRQLILVQEKLALGLGFALFYPLKRRKFHHYLDFRGCNITRKRGFKTGGDISGGGEMKNSQNTDRLMSHKHFSWIYFGYYCWGNSKMKKIACLHLFLVIFILISCSLPSNKLFISESYKNNKEPNLFVFSADDSVKQVPKYGYIDRKGRVIIKAQFDEAGEFYEGLASVRFNNENLGYVDKFGKVNILPSSWKVEPYSKFSEGIAPVEINNKYGYIDKSLSIVISPQFIYAGNFREGVAEVAVDKKIGYIARSGKMVIVPQFDEGSSFYEGLAAVKLGGKWGYINKTGKIVIQPKFDTAFPFSEGLAVVGIVGTEGRKLGYISKTGKTVIPLIFSDALSFHQGLAPVFVNRKWGYINKLGKVTIPFQFDLADEFSEELAIVKIGNQSGYINKNGKIVIPPKFRAVEKFKNGLASVTLKNFDGWKWGYIDKGGKFVWSRSSI